MSIVEFPSQGTIGTTLQPKRYDIVIYQGDDFEFNFVLKDSGGTPIDISGWSAVAEIRLVSDNTLAPTPTMTINNDAPTTDGTFNVVLTDTETDILDESVDYKYDIQVTDAGGKKRTYIGGKITITSDVTEL